MNLDLLCYKKNGSALCYKKGGSDVGKLVYKGEPRLIYVVVAWSPESFVCKTYGATHQISGTCVWQCTSGVAIQVDSSTVPGEIRYTFKVTQRPATIVLTLTCAMSCAANEYADVTFRLMASQRNVTPKMRSVTPPGAPTSSATATLNVDATGNLISII